VFIENLSALVAPLSHAEKNEVIDLLWSLFPYWWLLVILAVVWPVERWYLRRRERKAKQRLRDYGWDDTERVPPPVQ
jgi:hypothetical protein